MVGAVVSVGSPQLPRSRPATRIIISGMRKHFFIANPLLNIHRKSSYNISRTSMGSLSYGNG